MKQEITFLTATVLLCIGAGGILHNRNLFKICISLAVMESAAILLVVALAYRPDAWAPIVTPAASHYVDPLPHALALTAIVIGAGITALALSLTVLVHRRLGTVDIEEARRAIS